jgi:hypothetical protein
VALGLPASSIGFLEKQWNARPLQAGSDTIRANFYDYTGGEGGGQHGVKRIQENAFQPPAKKYHSTQARLYPY